MDVSDGYEDPLRREMAYGVHIAHIASIDKSSGFKKGNFSALIAFFHAVRAESISQGACFCWGEAVDLSCRTTSDLRDLGSSRCDRRSHSPYKVCPQLWCGFNGWRLRSVIGLGRIFGLFSTDTCSDFNGIGEVISVRRICTVDCLRSNTDRSSFRRSRGQRNVWNGGYDWRYRNVRSTGRIDLWSDLLRWCS